MLKKHIYANHTDYDVIAKYFVSVEKLIGKKYMDRFREQTFLKLSKDTLDQFIEAAIGKKKPFKINELDYSVPIPCDSSMINADKRRLLHLKRRDIALKLASEVDEDITEGERFSRKEELAHLSDLLIWDLRIDTHDEFRPERVLRTLNLAKQNAKEDNQYLPRFKEFTRKDSRAFLRLDTQTVPLRSVIGDKAKMYH